MARTQPFSEITTVTGSRSTIASSIAARSCSGASANVVRRLPSGVFGPNMSRTLRDLLADLLPLLGLGAEQRLDALQLVAEVLVLAS